MVCPRQHSNGLCLLKTKLCLRDCWKLCLHDRRSCRRNSFVPTCPRLLSVSLHFVNTDLYLTSDWPATWGDFFSIVKVCSFWFFRRGLLLSYIHWPKKENKCTEERLSVSDVAFYKSDRDNPKQSPCGTGQKKEHLDFWDVAGDV